MWDVIACPRGWYPLLAQHFRIYSLRRTDMYPVSKVHAANMGPTWGRQDPGGPDVGHMNLAISVPVRPAIKLISVTDYKTLDCFPGFISKAYKIFETFRYSMYKIPEVKNIANYSPNKTLYKELNKQKG